MGSAVRAGIRAGALRATLASYAQCPHYYRALMAGGVLLRPERPAVRRGDTTGTTGRRNAAGGAE